MKITEGPKGLLMIDDAKLIFRNFSGRPSRYNSEGDRNFAVIIPDDESFDILCKMGWNPTKKPPREEGEEPLRILKVKVRFNNHPPTIRLESNAACNYLDETTVDILDKIDIAFADMDISPYHWEKPDGTSGVSAYLRSIRVVQECDRFARDNFSG